MSWALEEWKDGLPGKALQKIREIEGQLDKLKKERQQKQFQLDSLEAALQKQKQKVDQEKNEAVSLKKENQSLLESCDSLEKVRQKVTHELHVKEQQVNFLEGQLSSSKRQIEKLEQENKRYKSELDRSQSSHAVDLQPYSTPQKTFAAPITPNYRQHGSKFEDLQDKYNKEVEERKRLEAELKVMQVKAVNQSCVSHKDIARQQTQSSIFPWQQEQTPSRQSHSFMETPLKRKTGNSSFMWEQQETPLKQNSRNASASQSDSASTQAIEQLRTANQDLKLKVSELELRLQTQDKEMKNQLNKFKEIQSQLDNARRDLCEKDRTLSKSKDELSKMSTQYDQSVTKCSAMEQKLKQVTEEMNCQRHNAESSRSALEQKIKDQERESQKELAQLQNAQHALDQQFNQMKTKMSQELQQAKKDHNILQFDIDKVMTQKSSLERDLEELKQKLFRSEQALQTTQSKEMDLKKNFEEMQREKNGLSCQVEQGTKRTTQIEEELKATKQTLKESHSMVEDLKAKTQAQNEELKGLQIKMENLSRSFAEDLENLKKMHAQLEAEKQNEIKNQKTEIELMANKQSALEKEHQDLQQSFNSKQNECVELKNENESVLSWKNEKENLINNIETDRESMLSKIHELEKSLDSLGDVHRDLNEKMQNLENEKRHMLCQVDSLKGEILNKCMELEEKGRTYEELQKRSEESDQKHSKDMENTMVQITLLQGKVTQLDSRLKQETERVEKAEQSLSEVSSQYESACDLLKSKDSVLELKENEIAHLGDSLVQAVSQQEQQMAKFTEEKHSLIQQHEESLLKKNEEAEQAKLNYEKSQQDVLILQDQVVALESALKLHKRFSVELQSKHEELSKVKDDLQAKILEAKKSQEDILQEMRVLTAQAKSAVSLQEQCSSLSVEIEESNTALQSLTEALNQKEHELQTLGTSAEELQMKLDESKIKACSLENDNLHLKEKLHMLEKEAEVVSTKNESLQQAHNTLCGEKAVLLKENAILLTAIAEKEDEADNFESCDNKLESLQVKQEKVTSSSEQLSGDHVDSLSAAEDLQRKSVELEELSHAFEEAVRTLEGQMEAQRQASKTEIGDLKGLLDNAQNNLERLQQQHACEMKNWQQKTVDVRLEMDVKLAEERRRCVFLYTELESARLQMQGIDLRSRSLCVDNNECLLQPQKVNERKPEDLEEVAEFHTSSIRPLADMSNTVTEYASSRPLNEKDIFTLLDGKTVTQSCAVIAVDKHPDQGHLENLEENKKTVQKLQEELQTLRCQLELFTNEAASKKDLCNEMEDKMHKLEAEKSDSIDRLNAAIQEKRRLGVHLAELQEEVCSLKLQLQTSKYQLSDVMEMLENLEMAKGNWDDKFFHLENELKRARSEKANLEKHILSMEADMEEMQVKSERLQVELDASQKVGANFEQRLNVAWTEERQLKRELLSCTEEKENTDQTLSEWKIKAQQLEMNSCETRDLIKILEEDIRKGKRESEMASFNLDSLRKEKEQLLQQFQILERTIGLLNAEKESLLKEVSQFKEEQLTVARCSESMVSKIQLLEEENLRLSQTLESSLLEKGEIASRLNSTQEEVTQMRAGIEKLKVRIEADERKKRHMNELLKAAQRKSDSLQDSVEKLEREKDMTEQSLEDAILQAETAKTELEDLETEKAELTKTIEEVTMELGDLRGEKQRLERELVEKNEQFDYLQKSALVATANLKRVEKEMEEAERNRESTFENLKSQLRTLDCQLQACQSTLESAHVKEQGLAGQVSSLETERVALSLKLQEAEKLQTDLQTVNQSLKEECEAKQHEIRECKENDERYQHKVAELQMLRQMTEEKLSFIEGERAELEIEKMRLQSSSTEWEQKAQRQSTEGEVMQCTITSLEGNVKQLEDSLEATKLANAELTETMNTLQDHNLRLQSEMGEAEEMRSTFEQERLTLASELQSSQQQADNYKLSLEVLASEKEELRRNLDSTEKNLTQEIEEKEASHKQLLNKVQQQYKVELQMVKEELTAAEGEASKLLKEISILKSSKEELNSVLKERESKLEFSDKTKVDELNSKVASLLKEKDTALSKMNLWMKSCKQLEKEKQALLEENEQQGALITTLENSHKQGEGGCLVEDLQAEIMELKEALEDKTREADEGVEKYCNLMVSVHKLEQINEGLSSRLAQLARGRKFTASENRPHDEDGQSPSLGKRQRAEQPEVRGVTMKTQEVLRQVSKRICAGIAPHAPTEDDFRPEGLPELVQKGFADIPMGEKSPFIVRRTTAQRCSPRLAARRSASNTPDISVVSPKPPAEGSKHQNETKLHVAPAGNVSGVLAPVGNSLKTQAFESPVANTEGRKGRGSLSTNKTPEQSSKHRQAMTPAKQDENCPVQ
ncbi:hypothetical protein AAFF_G00361660 [Aldrovandia affinis]|uniref:Centromere protein F n=1 Tax=Aldrovandia affinis TaxID=143900 RepID=A0AAD7WMZ6_9TELE|nr:hypothetical protein AAFF_G00361660 [Aldrovandia affinis]